MTPSSIRFLWVWPIISLPLLINSSLFILIIGIFISNIFLGNIILLILKRRLKVNFFSLLACSLLIGYGLGSFTTLFTAFEMISNVKYISQYSTALWLVISSCFLLTLSSIFAHSIDISCQVKWVDKKRYKYKIFYSIVLLFLIIKYIIFGFGVTVDGGSTVAMIPLILNVLICAFPALIIENILKNESIKDNVYLFIILIITLILIMPLGRRAFIYSLILSFVWMMPYFIRLKISKLKFIFTAIILIGFVMTSNYFFLSLRLSSQEANSINSSSLQKLSDASKLFNSNGIQDINAYLRDANSDRAFVLRFFSDLVIAESKNHPMYGVETIESIKIVIPGFFGVKKFKGDIENIAQAHFKLNKTDEANSVLTLGISDFGIVGVYIIPILLMLLYQICFSFVMGLHRFPVFAKKVFILLLMFSVLNCENTLAGYIGVLRDAFLIGILVAFVFIFFNIKNSKLELTYRFKRLIT